MSVAYTLTGVKGDDDDDDDDDDGDDDDDDDDDDSNCYILLSFHSTQVRLNARLKVVKKSLSVSD